MRDDLPSEYDIIVVGTGMIESVVAAAASRIGKKVLHLDRNDYYGGLWASLNFDVMQKWIERCHESSSRDANAPKYDQLMEKRELIIPCGDPFLAVSNVAERWYIPENISEELCKSQQVNGANAWSQSKMKKLARKFNLDLAPKLLFSRGSLVDLLISSNIARYAEFRCVTRILTWFRNKLELVPCSRAEVFTSKEVSVVEKRLLMQLLQLCVAYKPEGNEFDDFQDKTFVEYLESKNLTDNILHYILYAIAMSSEKTPCMEAVERVQRFLSSLGRYGNTPFLWPLYGSGELPQCYCRLCAVYGGVYHLKRAADGLIALQNNDETVFKGIISEGQRLTANHLILGISDVPENFIQKRPDSGGLSRGIFITNKSILQSEKESLTLLQFPGEHDGEPITVIEVGPTTHACPSGLYIVHMTCKQVVNAEDDLKPAVNNLLCVEESNGDLNKEFQEDSDTKNNVQVLWSLYFNCVGTSKCDLSDIVPKNVYLTSGPDLGIDFEFAVQQAKNIFFKIYPTEEFLPRAPDPEEIVMDSSEEGKQDIGSE